TLLQSTRLGDAWLRQQPAVLIAESLRESDHRSFLESDSCRCAMKCNHSRSEQALCRSRRLEQDQDERPSPRTPVCSETLLDARSPPLSNHEPRDQQAQDDYQPGNPD